MPATSRAQRVVMAIAEHHPDQLYERNKGLLKMSHSQLHDFAATSEKNLPQYAGHGNPKNPANPGVLQKSHAQLRDYNVAPQEDLPGFGMNPKNSYAKTYGGLRGRAKRNFGRKEAQAREDAMPVGHFPGKEESFE